MRKRKINRDSSKLEKNIKINPLQSRKENKLIFDQKIFKFEIPLHKGNNVKILLF